MFFPREHLGLSIDWKLLVCGIIDCIQALVVSGRASGLNVPATKNPSFGGGGRSDTCRHVPPYWIGFWNPQEN